MPLTEDDKQWMRENFTTKDDLEQMETRLLTEFHKRASPFEARQRSHREAIRALDIEGEAMSDALTEVRARLKALEGKR